MELKGKPLTLGSKTLAVIIAVGSLILKCTINPTLDIDAALKVAAFVALVFASVDASLLTSNIRGTRHLQEDDGAAARKAVADKEVLYGR